MKVRDYLKQNGNFKECFFIFNKNDPKRFIGLDVWYSPEYDKLYGDSYGVGEYDWDCSFILDDEFIDDPHWRGCEHDYDH